MRMVSKLKQAIFFLLLIGIIVVASGCVRWPDGSDGEPEEPEYQLRITVKVAGEIDPFEGKYYIVLDTDGDPTDGPDYDLEYWEDDFYYVKLDPYGFLFTKVEEGATSMTLSSQSWSDDTLQVTIALSKLEYPDDSIDINVVTTDSGDDTYYDYLDNFFSIGTTLYSTANGITGGGPEEGGDNFKITEVTAEIISY